MVATIAAQMKAVAGRTTAVQKGSPAARNRALVHSRVGYAVSSHLCLTNPGLTVTDRRTGGEGTMPEGGECCA